MISELAADPSLQHPAIAKGGEQDWVKQGIGLQPDLEKAIFEAEVGACIVTNRKDGVHVLQVLEER